MSELTNAIDLICDKINTRIRSNNGVDITITGCGSYLDELMRLFNQDGNVMTYEAKFDNEFIFCWGITDTKHRAWVEGH